MNDAGFFPRPSSPAVAVLVFECADNFRLPTFVTDTIRPLLGYTESELMSSQWWQSQVHPADLGLLRAAVRLTRASGYARSKLRIRSKDSSECRIDFQMQGVQSTGGQVERIVCMFRTDSQAA